MTNPEPGSRVEAYWRRRAGIVGAFPDLDFLLFDRVLQFQAEKTVRGDLLEIGVLYGKSAIVLGLHAQSAETTIVCDVFESGAPSESNQAENSDSYPGLARSAFERNYAAWVDQPPTIIQEDSTGIASHVSESSLRFAHVDGSHLYEVVHTDLANVRSLLNPSGVLVIDDYNQPHTPGVAAAVWSVVVDHGLVPFCLSEQKLYASWNEDVATEMRQQLTTWARSGGDRLELGHQTVAGHPLLLLRGHGLGTPRQRLKRWLPPALVQMIQKRIASGGGHLGSSNHD